MFLANAPSSLESCSSIRAISDDTWWPKCILSYTRVQVGSSTEADVLSRFLRQLEICARCACVTGKANSLDGRNQHGKDYSSGKEPYFMPHERQFTLPIVPVDDTSRRSKSHVLKVRGNVGVYLAGRAGVERSKNIPGNGGVRLVIVLINNSTARVCHPVMLKIFKRNSCSFKR